MGQQLNIEIVINEKVQANAYYHWSAYTTSALKLVQTILRNINEVKEDSNHVLYSIRLLEKTGASLTEEEIEKISLVADNETFVMADDRNEGLIAFTDKGMTETREGAEHQVQINLDEGYVVFDVLSKYDKDTFLDVYEKNEEDYDKLPVLDVENYCIYFDDFNEVATTMMNMIKEDSYYLRTESGEVITFIA